MDKGGYPWWSANGGGCSVNGFKSCMAAEGRQCPTREQHRGSRCMFNEERQCNEGCVGYAIPGGCGLKVLLGDIAESLTMIIHHVRNLAD